MIQMYIFGGIDIQLFPLYMISERKLMDIKEEFTNKKCKEDEFDDRQIIISG